MVASLRKSRGFTLVELLVVISIIGLLMALLLPAVQAVRESARKTVCKNNLYQIGRASLQHVEKYGFFPSSGWGYLWIGDPDCGVGAHQPGGWVYNILPFMGFENVHDYGKGYSSDVKKSTYLPTQAANVIPLLYCPSRRRALAYPWTDSGLYNSTTPSNVCKTDYAANGGTWRHLGAGPAYSCLTTYPNCGWSNSDASMAANFNGVSGERSEVKPAQIIDGVSNTFLAGEKYLNPNLYLTGSDGADNDGAMIGNDWDINRWCNAANGWVPSQDTPGVDSMSSRFGSAHAGGCHFVMCDGSIRVIRYNIDPSVFEHLGNRKDQAGDSDVY